MEEILQRCVRWAEEQTGVRAMLLTGVPADANTPADPFADLNLLLAERGFQTLFGNRFWMEAFGRLLVARRRPVHQDLCDGIEGFSWSAQYDNGLKINFIFVPVEFFHKAAQGGELPAFLDAGYTILLDKEGLAQGIQPPTYRANLLSPPDEAEYREVIREFFHGSTYAAKHLWRGDLLPAKFIFDHAMKQDNLRKMLEWMLEIEHDWSLKINPYGGGLKQHLAPEIWEQLENTYTGADTEANWQALFESFELSRYLAVEVGEKLGYTYPHQLERRVVRYLGRVRDLEPDVEAFSFQ